MGFEVEPRRLSEFLEKTPFKACSGRRETRGLLRLRSGQAFDCLRLAPHFAQDDRVGWITEFEAGVLGGGDARRSTVGILNSTSETFPARVPEMPGGARLACS